MGRYGSIALSELRIATLEIACTRCPARRVYDTARLRERLSDVALPDLLANAMPICGHPLKERGEFACGAYYVDLARQVQSCET
jgi:hypothetical protein